MKDIKIKYSVIALSYLFLIFLIIISYVSIIPEEDVPILENAAKLIKEEKNNFSNNKNTVYEILEKKEKSIEDIIEKELGNKQEANLEIKKSNSNKVVNTKKKFRIQVASFKEKKKSLEVSKKLEKEFSSEQLIKFEVKQIVLKNNDIFFRVVNDETLTLEDAKTLCKKILDKKYQCLIVMDT
jgi:predicted transcriptional regulator|tara:strand:- start:56 stop:604 length:549 start_codon:yes stop_codon:yes gene_type:complete